MKDNQSLHFVLIKSLECGVRVLILNCNAACAAKIFDPFPSLLTFYNSCTSSYDQNEIKVSYYAANHGTHYHLILLTYIFVELHCFIPKVKYRGGGTTCTSTSVHHK